MVAATIVVTLSVRILIPIAVTALIRRLTAKRSRMAAITVWHGDSTEGLALVDASMRNCTCEVDPETGSRVSNCPTHEAIIHDQRFMDGLVFMRRYADRLLAEEFAP